MSEDEGEPIEVAASAGPLDPVVLLLREFLHRSGAVRAVAAVDRGAEPAALVDVAQLAPIEIADGERSFVLPHAIELDADPLAVPDVRQLPPFDVDLEDLQIAAPVGGVEHYADAVRAMAETLGGRSVVLATFATTTPDVPLTLSARGGEPLLITLGEESFELPGSGAE